MIFTCDKKTLSEAVSNIQRAVSTKSSLPALEGILIRASEDSVTLLAYDLELGMFTSVPARVSQPGEIVLGAKIFSDMVRKLPADSVEIKTDEKLMTTVTSGASEFAILGIPAAEFPELPAFSDGTQLSLPQNLLSSMIKQTIFAISADDSRPVLTGSLFDIKDGEMNLVSCDSVRLALRTEKIKDSGELRFIVPGKTLSEVLKMLDSDSDESMSMSVGKKHVSFEINGYTIISRLLEGEFLDYRSVLAGKNTAEVRVRVREFADSVDRASLLISERFKTYIRCIFESDRIRVKCSTSIGRIYDEISARLTGETLEMGFNNRYLMEALRATECDEIRIVLSGALSPMKLYPASGESFIFLVLPVRLKSNE